MTKDAIDALETIYKSSDDDDAYMLGYRDARAGKPAKPEKAAGQVDQFEGGDADADDGAPDGGDDDDAPGMDMDGDGDADAPAADVDADGDPDADDDAGDAQAQGDDGDGDGDDAVTDKDGDDGELPEDDGDNHGVGDLNEDGSVDSLIAEVADVEKTYYAAAGMHGPGHHKATKALDLYHRAVRKLVRALMGEPQPGSDEQQAQGDDDAGDDAQKPPFGKQDAGDEQQAQGDDDAGDDAQKPPFGKQDDDDDAGDDAGDDAQQAQGGDDEPPKKKPKKPFGKSFDALDALAIEYGTPREVLAVLEKSGYVERDAAGALRPPVRVAHAPAPTPPPRTVVHPNGFRDFVFDDPMARGAEGVRLARRHAPPPVKLADGAPVPRITGPRPRYAPDTVVRVTVDASCPIHGHAHEAIYKSHLVSTPYLKCSCKR